MKIKICFLELIVIMLGLFLALIPIAGVMLNFFGLVKSIFLFSLCFVLIVVFFFKIISLELVRPSKSTILAYCLFFVMFLIFTIGSFSYPWLEDDDPYGYAVVASYIHEKGTFSKQADIYLDNYIEPNTVGYPILLSSFYGIFGDMNFTLKFINALVISLALLFFFFLVKELFKDEVYALLSMFVLACLPSFLTHFIFATSFAMMIFILAFYFVVRSREEPLFVVPAILSIAGLLVTHHLVGFVFGLFFIIYLCFYREKNVLLCGAGGVMLSCLFWIPNLIKYGIEGVMNQLGINSVSNIVGTGDKLYGIKDFFFASKYNLINVPIGWGIMIFLLVIAFLVYFVFCYNKLHKNHKLVFMWFLLALLGLLSVYLPVKFMPFRWWTFLAIPVAIMAAFFINYGFIKKKYLIVGTLILCIIATSGIQKVQLNTMEWGPSGSLMQNGMLQGHLWLKDNLPHNTAVFSFHSANKLQGFNMFSCEWCEADMEIKEEFPVSLEKLHLFLKLNDYEYFIADSWYVAKYGENKTKEFMNQFNANTTDLFQPIFNNEGIVIFKVI